MGLYLHIPFCKQACHYCNFHFSTSLKLKDQFIEAILKEMEMQKDYLQDKSLNSIYFGGGTPSLLSAAELEQIFEKIESIYEIDPDAEITLEANPDDINQDTLSDLKNYTPINRLSIGIQSFFEEDLRWMNRAHSASEARQCIEWSARAGFENLTIDLIYGSPTTPDSNWIRNLDTAFEFEVPHLSCYALTVEEGTALAHFIKKGKSEPVDDERAIRQFEMLMDKAAENGYDHYEISNFARSGWKAKHNSSYWTGQHYLGLGPSAHSYNGTSRQWNLANNARYVKTIESGTVPFEVEVLTPEQIYNEYVMTSLRTSKGCSEGKIEQFPAHFRDHFYKTAKKQIEQGVLDFSLGQYTLTRKGKFLADQIAMELFVDEASLS